jgi:hypothetical protein
MGAIGPSGGQATKMADGIGAIKQGDYMKGIEKLLPSGVSNGLKAYRIANEGFTLKNGDVMFKPEDVTGFQLAMDALGMKSPDMKQMEWTRGQQYEIKRFYIDRTKEIQREYVQAYKAKDSTAMAEARKEWMELQDGKDRMRQYFGDSNAELKRQPLSTLLKYPQTSQKREQQLQQSAKLQ